MNEPTALVRALSLGALAALVIACAPAWSASEREAFAGQLDRALGAESDEALRTLYRERGDAPAWVDASGPTSAGEALLDQLARAREEGLDPAHYRVDALRRRVESEPADAGARLALDLAFSRAARAFLHDLAHGRVAPDAVDHVWEAEPREVDLAAALARAADGDVAGAAESVAPSSPAYRELRRALARYRAIAEQGPWPAVPDGPALEPGAERPRRELAALAARLEREGYEPGYAGGSDAGTAVYGAGLEEAVRRFQRERGIDEDGIVGPQVRRELAIPPEKRVAQIAYNLERWRWVVYDPGPRHLRVNLPSFELRLVEGGRTELDMKVVVGTERNASPVISDRVETVVFNPFWHVPDSIAVEELIPKIQEDVTWLARNDFEVIQGSGPEATAVDPASIDWDDVDLEAFPYRLRQKAGGRNALGRIKFLFPNQLAVYLHDTPAGEKFAHTDRAFSHGCIRVEKPVELAERLLARSGWDRDRIEEAIATGERQTVAVEDPIPVHVLYWTAFVNEQGGVEFHQDLYDVDRRLAAALSRRKPLSLALEPLPDAPAS